MFPTDFLIFLQILLFLFITPGVPRVLIVSHTLNYGLKRSIWTALGDISANTCQGILVVFVIGTFLKDHPEILSYLKWVGILLLGVLDKLTNVTIDYLTCQIKAGVHAIQIFDTWADVAKGKDLIMDRRVSGLISAILLICLPFYLGHRSQNPIFFGMQSY